MALIKMIKEEKVNGDINIKIFINGECQRVFFEKEEDIAEKYYEECFRRLQSHKYPKITLLKNDTI